MWLWQKHPGLVPGTQTNWASFEASVLANLPPGKCLRVFCSTKIMGTSHASDFLATTKVRIQLWSSLNRCLGQSIQRGYPKLDEICLNLPMDAHHPENWKKNTSGGHSQNVRPSSLIIFLYAPYFEYASTLTLYPTQNALQSVEERICWCKVPSHHTAGVTQAP